ncbi:MAG: adenylate kinase [Planctomycetota bacterium]|nr:MAG: adenylate kinase [Planctomycetota bacterium]
MLKRVNVVGTSGSGKSTFSKKLSEVLSLKYIDMDALFWEKNWTQASDQEFIRKIAECIQDDSWILDGNYSKTISLKWEKVDTIIWIDFSFIRTMYQSINRAISRIISNKELWEGTGNKESIKMTFFSKDSILLWTLNTFKSNRKKYEGIMMNQKYAHINFIRLTSPKMCEKFLIDLESQN